MGNRSSRWSLSRPVTSIEWALIMRFCPQKDLLRLARCSQSTLSAAANPIAWAERPPFVVDFAKLPPVKKGVGRSLLADRPLALLWTVSLTPSFAAYCHAHPLPSPCDELCSDPALAAADVSKIRALASMHSMHITGPYWLRERDWSMLWEPDSLQQLREITMMLPSVPAQPRISRDLHYFPVLWVPPSVLRYSRRVGRDDSWSEGWRSSADQPWISVYFIAGTVSIQLCEMPPGVDLSVLHPVSAFAFIAAGDEIQDAPRLVSLLRSRLSCAALMVHRGTGDDNGLKAMANCLLQIIVGDGELRSLFRLTRPRLWLH